MQFGIADIRDLTTSHTDDLAVNPQFPPELQPRDRERAGAQARNYQLEQDLNPKLLMNDVSAAGGAPIVGPDGVVESGNGRTIALRRSAMKGGEAYARYKAELAAQGHDTTGVEYPVLVRRRTQPMTDSQRSAMTHEMNADVTERMSATEQAKADAGHIDDAMLSHVDGTEPGRRRFAQAFLGRVAPDQINSLVAPDGRLSSAGQERIDAALTARAYGDPRLVEALHETSDSNIKTIGGALKMAAPFWAAMRSAAARGAIPADFDLTEALQSAVDLVRHARDNRLKLGDLVADLRGQGVDMFGARAISPVTETFLHIFFRDDGLTRPRAADKIADIMREYAERAQEMQPGPNLFGETANVDTARDLLENISQRFARGDAGDLDLLRPAGRADGNGTGGAAGDTRPLVIGDGGEREPGDGRDGGARPAGGGQAESPGDGRADAGEPPEPVERGGAGPIPLKGDERPAPDGARFDPAATQSVSKAGDGTPGGETEQNVGSTAAPVNRALADRIIASTPELKALADDTARWAAENGLAEPEATEPQKPMAEAIQAAADCLSDAAEELF